MRATLVPAIVLLAQVSACTPARRTPGAAVDAAVSSSAQRSVPRALDAGQPESSKVPPALGAFDPAPVVFLPDAPSQVPLLVILHGLGGSGEQLAARFSLAQLAKFRRFAMVAPSGDRDGAGRRFWNAGPACCDFDRRAPDDVARLRGLIEYAVRELPVDPGRVMVIGFSNGGFMAHRMACEAGDLVAVAASVAGAASGLGDCRLSGKLSLLEVHGDADRVVPFGGGRVFDDPRLSPFPSVEDTIGSWRRRLGCAAMAPRDALDLEPNLPGQETEVKAARCARGDVELWRVRGGGHEVALGPGAFDALAVFLEGKRKR